MNQQNSTTETQATPPTRPEPVNFIRFHGLTLLVVRHEGIDYVPLKPLCDLASIDWRNAKRACSEGDLAELYGSTLFLPPAIAGLGGDITPLATVLRGPTGGQGEHKTPTASDSDKHATGRTTLHIRLDRAYMFLARISTDRMRAHGKATAAAALLSLQKEWADVLHRYENGEAVMKPGRHDSTRELRELMKSRDSARTAEDRALFDALLRRAAAALGQPMPEPSQRDLPL